MIHKFGGHSGGPNAYSSIGKPDRSDMEQEHPLIQMHDPESHDVAFANRLANEIINISGANVVVYPRTDNSDVDEVWEEDPNPTYGSGRHLKAYFAPQPLEAQLTPWGVEAPNQTDVVFARDKVFEHFSKRMIRIGDIISLPYNSMALKPDKYRVLNAFDSGNFRYDWLYYTCRVENITDDITIDIDHK